MSIEQQVKITTDTKSLADLRNEIRDIQSQLDLTPTGTKEYDALVVRLRQAKGELKDFKETTKGLDPDQRAAKLVNAFQGMTGAIQAAAGAITLFGGNSDDLEKVEKNLLGIIAIGGGVQQTIEGFNDAADIIGPTFTKLGSGIKTAFTTAEGGVKGFKVALASIGIGLVIAAITTLIENFDAIKEALVGVNTEVSLTDDQLKNLSSEVGKSSAQLEILTKKVQNQNLSEKERLKALKQLQELYPNYFKNIGNDINNTKGLTAAKDKLNQTLLREAKVRALQDQLAKVYAENIEEEITLTGKLEKNTKRLEELKIRRAQEFAKGQVAEFVATQKSITSLEESNEEIGKSLDDIRKKREKNSNIIISLINKEDLAIQKLGGTTEKETDKQVKSTEKKITAAEAEVNKLNIAVAAKRSLYEDDIVNLNKLKNEELKGAIDSAERREGIEIKYAALQVERGKKLGNELLKVVEDSEKRYLKKDKEVLDKRAEVARQGQEIINKSNADEINATIKAQEKVQDITIKGIQDNLQTLLTGAQRTIETEQSIFAKLIDEYKQLNANNYEQVFDDQDQFYNFLVERLREYGMEVDKETAEQIRQRGLAEFKAREDTQKAIDKYYKDAIALLRTQGEEGNKLADELEKERIRVFNENQDAKLAKAIETGQKEIDVAKKTQLELTEIVEFGANQAKDLAQSVSDFADAASNKELASIQKQIDAQTKLAKARGASQEELTKIEEEGQARLDAVSKKAFERQQKFAIGIALIDTYLAAQKAYASQIIPGDPSSNVRGIIAAAVATAAGLARVKLISSQNYEGTGGTGGTGSAGGSTGGGSNILNPFAGQGAGGTNILPPRLAPPSGGGGRFGETIGREATGTQIPVVKAYVLAGDVTDAQTAEAKINEKRKL